MGWLMAAYELGKNVFGEEALTELISCVTDPKHADGKTVVILAGYKANMLAMLDTNPGAKSRFRKTWEFPDWTADDCTTFVARRAQATGFTIRPDGGVPAELRSGFAALLSRPGWANARDAVSAYEEMVEARAGRVYDTPEIEPEFVFDDANAAMAALLKHQPEGESVAANLRHSAPPPRQAIREVRVEYLPDSDGDEGGDADDQPRASDWRLDPAVRAKQLDKGVDVIGLSQAEIEKQVYADMAAEQAEAERLAAELRAAEEAAAEAERQRAEAERLAQEEEMRRLAAERARQEAIAAERRRALEAAQREALAQKRIRQAGVCCAGFRWNKIAGGYQCAGGSHYLSDGQLGLG
ncbi:uncharacterized protein AMSG_08835 [Thecamonas trahens ATCC 50062]|uniref:Uncharacterized protein n=1 Tax=Thecamonas trahens ATCC 50062 TaxID=461836 RepID=A0A0L0DMR9_THETB|nr:hypothetical protein AMSG_08835 [Thecamonas trahens ATCC 50062]KNC53336.1 hypothetical protein AMSG_08835 [Thecamonas trahens ATCC 50062]|eukprot:XP_013754591.1 hypothetical protein AMSG_08835 [Thecamonas trahens ATCC 50062]